MGGRCRPTSPCSQHPPRSFHEPFLPGLNKSCSVGNHLSPLPSILSPQPPSTPGPKQARGLPRISTLHCLLGCGLLSPPSSRAGGRGSPHPGAAPRTWLTVSSPELLSLKGCTIYLSPSASPKAPPNPPGFLLVCGPSELRVL